MKTSGQQTSLFGEERLTSLPAVSPANRTLQHESEKGRMMIATCGRKCLEQFERFNQAGSWAKTFAGLLVGMKGWYSTRCRLTWKLKATKFSRFYFQLAVSTLDTEEIGFGLLPTVTTDSVSMRKGKYKQGGQPLSMAALKLLPTPTASSDAKGGCTRPNPKRQQDTLAHAMHGLVGQTGKTSQLNPLFVLEMMGFPPNWTELPFLSGETNQSKLQETQ